MLLILGMLAAGGQATPPSLSWMTGNWCTAPHPSTPGITCERWEPIAGGGMRGAGETRRDGKATPQERIDIRREGGGYIFHAEPPGQAPTDFRAGAEDVAELAVTFTNAAHDYPQRIRYWRDGEALMAEIAMANGSRAVTWKYLPAN